jgi:hypothetical protein
LQGSRQRSQARESDPGGIALEKWRGFQEGAKPLFVKGSFPVGPSVVRQFLKSD